VTADGPHEKVPPIHLTELGRSGVVVSAIGLGGVELGPEDGETADVDRAAAVIETALAHGINWIDTAETYHDTANETLIGETLRRLWAPMLIATKVAPDDEARVGRSGHRPEQIRSACEESLRRLGRDVIDIYFLHWPADSGVPVTETWGAMAGLVDLGLVRAIGMSNYDIAAIDQCHRQRPVDVVQEGLSLIDHLDNRELVAQCHDRGIGVTIYEPLASGVLGGRSVEEVRAAWASWSEMSFYQRLLIPGRAEHSWAVVDGLRSLADRLGVTVPQLAIAWVLQQPGVDCAIVGSRSGAHIGENASAADVDLSAAIADIEALIPLGPAFN
jgi:aryl-alcohol dehydrogenase-like predicted oxidoreductase